MNISVIGSGSWGTTLAILLARKNFDVTLWTHKEEYFTMMSERRENSKYLAGISFPSNLKISQNLDDAVNCKDVIVFGIPSQQLRSVLEKVQEQNFKNSILVNLAKGIETSSLKLMNEVILSVLKNCDKNLIATLSGPSHAEEVCLNIPTAVVSASFNIETAKQVQEIFITDKFRVYASSDIIGIEIGGSLKNIIAIGAGIIDGANFGDNTKAALITRSISEITRLGIFLGAKEKTFAGLSGLGDLFVTCTSKHSRNRYVGEQIGKGRKLDFILREMKMVAEGVYTTRSAYLLSQKCKIETPIINEMYAVLFDKKDAKEATYDLMKRIAKEED